MTQIPAGLLTILVTCTLLSLLRAGQDSEIDTVSFDDPGSDPVLFAPGLVSTEYEERDLSLAPDGESLFYTVQGGGRSAIAVLRRNDEGWSGPQIASFSGRFNDLEAFASPDGTRLYFASNRPIDPSSEDAKDFDIWFVELTDKGFGKPTNAGPAINSEKSEFYPSIARNGSLYITARPEDGLGGEDICLSRSIGGQFEPLKSLGEPINSPDDEYNAFVAPDESFIAFGRGGRMLISARRDDGSWTTPVDLSAALDPSHKGIMCPALSPNGETFFFTSSRVPEVEYPTISKNADAMRRKLFANADGALEKPRIHQDIYWMSSSLVIDLIIDALDKDGG